MKIIIMIFIAFCSCYMNAYIKKVKSLEEIICELYKDDFKDYLFFDSQNNLKYDVEKLKIYFESKGLKVIFNRENLSFIVCFDFFGEHQRQYNFYLVKNDEIK